MKHSLDQGHNNQFPTLKIERGKELFYFDLGTFDPRPKDYERVTAIGISHFHQDHIKSIDNLINSAMISGTQKTVLGPKGTAERIAHRTKSIDWNLIGESKKSFHIKEITFEGEHDYEILFPTGEFNACSPKELPKGLEAVALDHKTPSVAFSLQDENSIKVDISYLTEIGLKPGPWIQKAKESYVKCEPFENEGQEIATSRLFRIRKRSKITYSTDFGYIVENLERLSSIAKNSDFMYCEGMFKPEDYQLALRTAHLTTDQSRSIIKAFSGGNGMIFHQSSRYGRTKPEIVSGSKEYDYEVEQNYFDPKNVTLGPKILGPINQNLLNKLKGCELPLTTFSEELNQPYIFGSDDGTVCVLDIDHKGKRYLIPQTNLPHSSEGFIEGLDGEGITISNLRAENISTIPNEDPKTRDIVKERAIIYFKGNSF